MGSYQEVEFFFGGGWTGARSTKSARKPSRVASEEVGALEATLAG